MEMENLKSKNENFKSLENENENDNQDIKQEIIDDKSVQHQKKHENSESKVLLITNLQRPFATQQLNDLILKTGNIVRIWLDQIKTHCIVEQAIKTKEALSGMVWPVDGKRLRVDFTNLSELDFALEKKISNYALNLERENLILERQKEFLKNENKVASNMHNNINMILNNDSNIIHQENFAANYQNEKESVKTLDTLFRKTSTKPNVYYLPLTEEEVLEKKKRLKMI